MFDKLKFMGIDYIILYKISTTHIVSLKWSLHVFDLRFYAYVWLYSIINLVVFNSVIFKKEI